ncbi:testis-expressed protein 11-like [Limulus polyphemus]|uniref:Testis-expressed protein 11-like n=1 Tax=Limulus polyphemus TaxID=6850 RepID=A0ABM1SQ95_LIMPO|nr:testis-expressed protein 11-like [Limulus polyphemus]
MDCNSTYRYDDLLIPETKDQKINTGSTSRLHECSPFSVTSTINFVRLDGISATGEINNLDRYFFSSTCKTKNNMKYFLDTFIAIQGKEKEVESCFLENLREFLSKIIETFTSGNTSKLLEQKDTLDSFFNRCIHFIMNAENYFETTEDDNSKINFYYVAVLVLVSQKLVKNKENGNHVYKDILSCVNKAGLFLDIQKDQNNSVDIQEESGWYMKVCWNLALQSDVPSDVMFDLFNQCCHFLSICNIDIDAASQIRYKTCLLMAAASGINAANQESNSEVRETITRKVLAITSECKQLVGILETNSAVGDDMKKIPTLKLLLLYEFEAKTIIKCSTLECTFEEALVFPDMDAKSFEVLAAIAKKSGLWCFRIVVRALKVSITKHLENENCDFIQLSKDYHSLIEVLFKAYSGAIVSTDKEAQRYVYEVLSLVKKAQDQYPEIEVVWLMTKTWNFGVQNYLQENLAMAKEWCGISFQLLQALPTFKNSYENKLQQQYKRLFET